MHKNYMNKTIKIMRTFKKIALNDEEVTHDEL